MRKAILTLVGRKGLAGIARIAAICLSLVLSFAPAQAQTPATCTIGVNVEDIYDLDMARDTLGVALWVWSICPSADLTPLQTITFPTATTGLNLGAITAEDITTGGQYTARRVQGIFRYNWAMRDYPFDRQRIIIPIDESEYTADRLVFQPDTKESFLTPDIRERLSEWHISDLSLTTSISEEASTYGMPEGKPARFARLEASFTMERVQLLTFLKLTAGIYAGVFIAFLSFFYDPNDRSAFGGKLGLLVGVLFAILINMRSADTFIGDIGQNTLVTMIHMVTLGLVVVLAMVALVDRRRTERGAQVRHPDWPTLLVVGLVYFVIVAGLILRAAWGG